MDLNQEQRDAVESKASRITVIAGAGSGKTRVLIGRMQWLLNNGVSPSEILAITFTRKAAGELLTRMDQMDDESFFRGAFAGTFHSLCYQIIADEGYRLSGIVDHKFTVLDATESDVLLRQVCQDLGYYRPSKKAWKEGWSLKKVKAFFRQWRNAAPGDVVRGERDFDRVMREYETQMFANGCLDFDGLIGAVLRLFERDVEFCLKYQYRWSHVLVDEIQDASADQWQLLDHLCPPADLFVVGDPRQSIYGFRGAVKYGDWGPRLASEVMSLDTCYRCSQSVLSAANGVSKAMKGGWAGMMPPDNHPYPAGEVRVVHGRTGDMIPVIRGLHASGYKWDEIAVLARARRSIKRLATFLEDRVRAEGDDIPYKLIGRRLDFTDSTAFREHVSLLKMAVNPYDYVSWLTWARPRFESHELIDVRVLAETKHLPIASAFMQAYPDHWLTDWFHTTASLPLIVDAADTLTGSGACAHTNFWADHCLGLTVEEGLRWLATYDPDRENEEADDCPGVTLSTIHAAKGLEWPCVLILDCNENSIPSSQSIKEKTVDEERRVFYVALTRAKERALLHVRRPEDQSSDRPINQPSRFLAEAGVVLMTVTPDPNSFEPIHNEKEFRHGSTDC